MSKLAVCIDQITFPSGSLIAIGCSAFFLLITGAFCTTKWPDAPEFDMAIVTCLVTLPLLNMTSAFWSWCKRCCVTIAFQAWCLVLIGLVPHFDLSWSFMIFLACLLLSFLAYFLLVLFALFSPSEVHTSLGGMVLSPSELAQ